MSKKMKVVVLLLSIAAVAILAMGVFAFVSFRIVKLPTGSMANTIVPGESVLCLMNGSEIRRGQIVLFKLPTDPKILYLKRVIGLPGDLIQVRGAKVFINGQEFPEARTYIELTNNNGAQPELSFNRSEGDGPYRVYYERREADDSPVSGEMGMKYGVTEALQIPSDRYFVMGDCRDNSLDSRYWGTVPRANIIGRALMIVATNDPKRQSKLFEPLK